jgi:hypothetical protein
MMRTIRREKVFGPGRAVPLDRNAKVRIAAYARAGAPGTVGQANTRVQSPAPSWTSCRRCCGPSTTAATAVASYQRIAENAGCARSTVAEALKALEWAGVLTWQHRITRIRERCRDLFGHDGWRWRVIRTSNAYVFSDLKPQIKGVSTSKSENPTGTQDQDILDPVEAPARASDSPLERVLSRFGVAIAMKAEH